MKLNPATIILVLTACILSACGNRPMGVLSEQKMEDVLYDMYLAGAEIEDNYPVFNNDSVKKQEILDAVFKKHKITEQKFDTSLVWYSGNLEKYFKIYDNLIKRYSTQIDTLRFEQDLQAKALADLNRVNIWKGETYHILRSAGSLENTFTFRLDSVAFKEGDTYELRFDVLGLHDSIQPTVTFCVQRPDTTYITREKLTQNGSYTTTLSSFGKPETKVLYGSIHVPGKDKEVYVIIHHFAIYQQKAIDHERTELRR